MYGFKAFLIFLGFLAVASGFVFGLIQEWRNRREKGSSLLRVVGTTIFILAWFAAISSVYIGKARFHYELYKLRSSEVYSIHIGHHDFTDRQTLEEIVGALRRNRWFEINHGGWGDSVLITVRKTSGELLQFDAAYYLRADGAIIGPRNKLGLTEAFAPELPHVLEKYGVTLPHCDTAHGQPCTAAQLNP